MGGYRKYPYPHNGGNWKFWKSRGSNTHRIPEGRRVEWSVGMYIILLEIQRGGVIFVFKKCKVCGGWGSYVKFPHGRGMV